MKLNRSITRKLFFITIIIFTAFISITLLVQSLFFGKYYIYKKQSDLESNMSKFMTSYNNPSNKDKESSIIEEYEDNYNIRIAILDSSNNIKFVNKAPENRYDPMRIREITSFIKDWTSNASNVSNIKQSGIPVTVVSNRRELSYRSIVYISPTAGKDEIVFAISSLQPVNEAVSVIKQLYLYFYIGAFIISILLALIYSNMIAKPLIKINRTATKMAHLDFTEKCVVSSQDEIGNVAASLNFLSGNLDEALNSLKSANAKLEKDIEKERNLEKMRKEFIASVSHELKTPISLIDGYAEGLKDEIFEGEEKDYYLDVIIDESRKMGNLVSDMLDLSQLESGSFKLTREDFILTDLILHTIKKYSALINEKRITLRTELIENLKVNADWTRMEQVITNFITNAIRHTNEDGRIYIKMIDKGDMVSVEVENSGSKINEEELEKIWDKFYKIDKSRSRKLGGTGIGLSIVKNILNLHGYSFAAENTEDGVKFYFNVPKL